jgi:DNA polymerase III subunit epsilon
VDRIVEIAVLKVLPDGSQEMKVSRINPEMPIPFETSLIHGIYDEDVKDEPTFKQIGQEFADFLIDCDLAGYNSNKFDIPMLMEEFLRAGVAFELEDRKFVDVQNIFHQMEQRTLKAAYKFYCGKQIENAHSAEADIRATYECFWLNWKNIRIRNGKIKKAINRSQFRMMLTPFMYSPI